jgi:IclR family transcriptional regulator, KDG regulon repressor
MYKSPMTKKVLQVLEFLGNGRTPLGVCQIANALSMNKSTLFGILKALEEEGYVIKDPAQKTYTPGEGLLRLSKLAFRPLDIAALARPFLRRLAKVADETAFFGLREESFIKVVAIVEARKAIRISSREGAKLPLVAGAFGKAFLSAVSEGELLELLEETGLPRFTEKSNQQMGLFLQELQRARKLGYAPDLDEYVGGVAGLAAPVTAAGQAVGAVWVAGLSASMQSLKLFGIIRCLKETARSIGTAIGSHPASCAPLRTADPFDIPLHKDEGMGNDRLSQSGSRRARRGNRVMR